jgi:hypothetical protein
MGRLACITLAVVFAVPASAQQPKQVGLNDAPPHVSAAALAVANGVKFEKVEIEFKDGHAVFECGLFRYFGRGSLSCAPGSANRPARLASTASMSASAAFLTSA